LPLLPKLPGLAWPRKESIETSTIVKRSVSGRRVAQSLFSTPIYYIELQYAGLYAPASGRG
ncbi:MAG: hypothetical protein ACRETD_12965, partial [Steroidobacteraceae bacterium]